MKSLEKKNFSINVHVKARSYMFVPAKYASAEVPVLEHPVLKCNGAYCESVRPRQDR